MYKPLGVWFYLNGVALDVREDGSRWTGMRRNGCGSRVRTGYTVACPDGRVRRVYVCQWGATGAYYVNVKGERVGLATSYTPVRPSAHGAA